MQDEQWLAGTGNDANNYQARIASVAKLVSTPNVEKACCFAQNDAVEASSKLQPSSNALFLDNDDVSNDNSTRKRTVASRTTKRRNKVQLDPIRRARTMRNLIVGLYKKMRENGKRPFPTGIKVAVVNARYEIHRFSKYTFRL